MRNGRTRKEEGGKVRGEEDRRQKAEDRRQRTEDRRQISPSFMHGDGLFFLDKFFQST
jgi:hypothetical protein